MAHFSYVAVTKSKKTLTGGMDAPDKDAAVTALKEQGLKPISVRLASSSGANKTIKFLSFEGKVKADDLVMFTRQLSAMVSAGVPIIRSLGSLAEHNESKQLSKILKSVIRDIEGGMPLADALSKFPETFNDVYVNMVRAGEAAGILDDILKRLALQQEKSARIRKKVRSAMSYPIVLMVITVLAFFGLMFFVIPEIGKIVKDLGGPDAELPALTQTMLGISGFMRDNWYIIIPALAIGIFGITRYIKTPKGKRIFHKFILKLPGFKNIIKKLAVARFARTFSALTGAGVPIIESLNVTSRAIGNISYQEVLEAASKEIKNGKSLSGIIEKSPLFPAIVPQMLLVGEETGETEKVLIKVADFYEEEVDAAIDGISSIIEPVMILIMGGMVGVIAASVMGPIAGLAQNIK